MPFKRALLSLLIMLPVLTGCGTTQENVTAGNSIVYGLTLEPSGIDPHIHRSAELGIVLRQVYDTLVYRHPDTKEIVPGLATEWTVSEDGLIYTFILREDVTFHDGTAFDAEAVAANLDRIMDPETLSQRAVFMLGSYDHYEIVDDYTIRFVLSEPYVPLLDSLSQVYLGIASPTALREYSNNRYQFHQVGTGPFRFEKYTPGSEIVIRRYEDYGWGPDFYTAPGENSLDTVIFRFFEDPPTRALALESGEAQIMGELLPSDARALTGNSQVRLQPTDIPGEPLQLMINTERYPTDNITVRQALLFATNRSAIADTVFQGFSPVAWGPLSSKTLYYNPEVVGLYDYDPQQARNLLASVGFEDTDGNGYLDAGDGDFEVVILVPPWGHVLAVSELIQDQWREVGVRAVLQRVPGFNALRQEVAEGEYNLVAFDAPGYDPSVLNETYLSTSPNNYMNFESPDLDNALIMAVREMAPSVRRGRYAQIQRFIMDNVLMIPIRDYVNLNATTPEIQGLQYDPYGWFPLLNNVTLSGG